MNKVEGLLELMKRDVKLILIAEKDVEEMKLNLEDDLKKAEEKCDSYEEMYKDDLEIIMTAYEEYDSVRGPLTQLEELLRDFKINLINHYERLLIEKELYNQGIANSLNRSKKNLLKMDDTVEIIKGVLI